MVVAQSISPVWVFWDPMDWSLPGYSVHGISQARILERVAIAFSRGSSWLRDWTHVSCTSNRILYHWATWDALLTLLLLLLTSYITMVQFSRSVVSNSLRPHELQHARPSCPSPTPRVHSNSCPSRWWCHPAISSSFVPFSSCPNPSQHQGLFQWVNSLHEVAKVLEFEL